MASMFGHVVLAYAMGKSLSSQFHTARFWWFTMACCLLPDVDVLGLALGIPYEHTLGHRGLTHSIVFAMLVGLVVPRWATPAIAFGPDRIGCLLCIFFSSPCPTGSWMP